MKNSEVLSKREAEVMRNLAKGMKSREIGQIMSLNERTVGTFIKRIRKKVGIDSNRNLYVLVNHCVKKKYI